MKNSNLNFNISSPFVFLFMKAIVVLSTLIPVQSYSQNYNLPYNNLSVFHDQIPPISSLYDLNTATSTNLSIDIVRNFSSLKHKTVESKLFIMLDLGEDYYESSNTDFSITLDYTVQLLDQASIIVGNLPGSITLNRLQPRKLDLLDITNHIENTGAVAAKLVINVSGPFDGNTDPLLTPLILKNYIEQEIRLQFSTEHYYGIDVRNLNSNLIVSPLNIVGLNNGINSRYVNFAWNLPTNVDEFPNYELQILKLYNTDEARMNNGNEIQTTVNWSGALRIETQSPDLNINMAIAEGTGFYIWRVRPIGNYFAGGIGNSENYGKWSIAPHNGDVLSLDKLALNHYSFYLFDSDQDINWIYNRTFTDGDKNKGVKMGESITYSDALLNPSQQQVYNSEEETVLTNQTLTDYSGRQAFSTLPAPEQGKLQGYKSGFLRPDGQPWNLYTAFHFDENSKLNNPSEVYSSGTSSFSYYSDNNLNLNVPDAQNYPFTRTLFKTDGTSRLSEQSGVGSVHALGEQIDGKGRTTRYRYSIASDDELIRLFGEEAPLSQSVLKTFITDPNNVISVTYTSKEGNVIATGLQSESTDNLDFLSNAALGFTINNSTDQNELSENRFISSRKFALSALTNVTLMYELDGNITSPACLGGDECDYSVVFFLNDLSSGEKFVTDPLIGLTTGSATNLGSIVWQNIDNTSSALPPISTGNILPLPAGEYIITKVVFSALDDDFIFTAVDDYEKNLGAIIDAIAEEMEKIENEDDYIIFENFMNNLETALAISNTDFLIALGINPSIYSVPDNFTLAYSSDPLSNDPASLSIGTLCCGNSTLLIDKPPICIPCELIDDIKESSSSTKFNDAYIVVNEYFIDYLKDHLLDQNIPHSEIEQFAPGFTYEGLGYMITNMMLSKYFTGNSLFNNTDNKWYKAVENENGELVFADVDVSGNLIPTDPTGTSSCGTPAGNPCGTPTIEADLNNSYNYTCKELYNCWQQAVIMLNQFGFEEDVNIMDNFNLKREETSGSGSGAAEGEYDDKENRDKEKFGDAVINFIISLKMRKYNDSDEGNITKEKAGSRVKLVSLFMDCAGYQFASILDEEAAALTKFQNFISEYSAINSNTPAYNNILNISSNLLPPLGGVYAPVLYSFSTSSPLIFSHPDNPLVTRDVLYYPYIVRPEWMFKYFVYNTWKETGINDEYKTVGTHPQIELNSCFNPPNCTTAVAPMCFYPCRYYHENWNSGQRLNFYQQIKDAPTFSQILLDEFVDVVCYSPTELEVMAAEKIADARASCESRRPEIISRLVKSLSDACYDIVDCPPFGSQTQVSMKQINKMASLAIAQCLNEVDAVELNLSLSTIFPSCSLTTCTWISDSGNCLEKSEMNITLFEPCDQKRLDQVNYWTFMPYIEPLTGCTTPPNPPEWHPGCPQEPCPAVISCSPSNNKYSNVFSVSTAP
ncbi:MAG: hypothetical protein M3Q58_12425 [Bacteroidota bacterium]|nr:hypothetical protein [Bacteroidota bacterium]